MMDGSRTTMMWGMRVMWLLVVTVLVLDAAALLKYLFGERR